MGIQVSLVEAAGRERSKAHMAVVLSLVRPEVHECFVPDGYPGVFGRGRRPRAHSPKYAGRAWIFRRIPEVPPKFGKGHSRRPHLEPLTCCPLEVGRSKGLGGPDVFSILGKRSNRGPDIFFKV